MAEALPNDINIHMPIHNPSSRGTRYTHALSSDLQHLLQHGQLIEYAQDIRPG